MMSDHKSATPDIDTQIESLLENFETQMLHDLQDMEADHDYSPPNRIPEAHNAIKTLLIQSKIEELEAIMDFDDEPVHLNFDEEINPITVGERIDQLKEEL